MEIRHKMVGRGFSVRHRGTTVDIYVVSTLVSCLPANMHDRHWRPLNRLPRQAGPRYYCKLNTLRPGVIRVDVFASDTKRAANLVHLYEACADRCRQGSKVQRFTATNTTTRHILVSVSTFGMVYTITRGRRLSQMARDTHYHV